MPGVPPWAAGRAGVWLGGRSARSVRPGRGSGRGRRLQGGSGGCAVSDVGCFVPGWLCFCRCGLFRSFYPLVFKCLGESVVVRWCWRLVRGTRRRWNGWLAQEGEGEPKEGRGACGRRAPTHACTHAHSHAHPRRTASPPASVPPRRLSPRRKAGRTLCPWRGRGNVLRILELHRWTDWRRRRPGLAAPRFCCATHPVTFTHTHNIRVHLPFLAGLAPR